MSWKRIVRSLQFILIVLFLTGCTNTEPVQIERSFPRPPDSSMIECETDLPDAKGPTRRDILEARAKTARQMLTCAERHKTLRNYVQDIISPPK